jgi:hypothetical protein
MNSGFPLVDRGKWWCGEFKLSLKRLLRMGRDDGSQAERQKLEDALRELGAAEAAKRAAVQPPQPPAANDVPPAKG